MPNIAQFQVKKNEKSPYHGRGIPPSHTLPRSVATPRKVLAPPPNILPHYATGAHVGIGGNTYTPTSEICFFLWGRLTGKFFALAPPP